MEQRDGIIEFRVTEQVDKKHHHKVKILEYRQCFKGIWQPWKEVIKLGD